MGRMEANKIAQSYTEQRELYADFAEVVASLMKSIVTSEHVPFYVIDYRAKTTESLRDKVLRKRLAGKEYGQYTDVTDLAGVRIVLFFSDDVYRVRDLVCEEFACQEESKTKVPESGKKIVYLAEHRTVQLAPRRARLREYKQYKGLFCEVQIKTILQHAWAEIEHDIGYKPKVSEKDLERTDIRSLFGENARLLKKVENNFVTIRNKHAALLATYAERVGRRRLKSLPVNIDTIRAYLKAELHQARLPHEVLLHTMELAQQHNCA